MVFLPNPKGVALRAMKKMEKVLPDRLYLKILFKLKVGYKLNLKTPKTFNEKLSWLKLYDRQSLYTRLADKYAVKNTWLNVLGIVML